ncbi:MAG: caspase family protein [Bacteroidota bacterium]
MPDNISPHSQVYVLLVGIDEYKNVSPLEGCKNDVALIESFLKEDKFSLKAGSKVENKTDSLAEAEQPTYASIPYKPLPYESYEIEEEGYSHLHICKLLDGHATYANIIYGFDKFLGMAKSQDKIWFHYSGHGTQSTTAEVFASLEDKKDQCLVCHDYMSNRVKKEKKNLLADKELAALIHRLAGEEQESPHILISIDACHSEGLTRFNVMGEGEETASRSRFFDTSEEEDPAKPHWRPLESYLAAYYSQQSFEEGDMPEIPVGRHTVLTACDDLQTAGENEKGYFTQGLIDTLKKFKGNINYADLMVLARSEVRRVKRDKQTPQFDVLGGAHPKSLFLDGSIHESEDKYEILHVNNREHRGWVLRCGTLNGLPQDEREFKRLQEAKGSVLLRVFKEQSPDAESVEVEIEKIGAVFSTLESRSDKLNDFDKERAYFASFNYFPAPLSFVKVSGEEEDVIDFLDEFADHKKFSSRHIVLVNSQDAEAELAKIELLLEDEIRLKQSLSHKEFGLTYSDDRRGINKLTHDISQIVKWERLLKLENTARQNGLQKHITFKLNLEGREGKVFKLDPQFPLPSPSEIAENFPSHRLDADQKTPIYEIEVREIEGAKEWDQPGYIMFFKLPSFTVKGKLTKVLNAYLFFLKSNFKISGERVDSDVFVNTAEIKEIEFARDGKRNWGLWGHHDGPHLYEQEDFIYAKLIVTDGILDYNRFLQEGIGSKSRRVRSIQQVSLLNEWTTATLKIQLKRA